MDIKLNLNAIANMHNFIVHGADAEGSVDLEFKNMVSAASFVASTEISDRTTFTFPDMLTGFNHPVTITVRNYTDVFQPLN